MKQLLSIFILILFAISCNFRVKKRENVVVENEPVFKFIQQYLKDKAPTQQYIALQKTFHCYYRNAVVNKRRNYSYIDSALGEEFFGLDSLILFNVNMDSAIIFFITKLANNDKDGFQYYAKKLFAYESMKGWRFYDGCGTAVYNEKKYSYTMARNNERLWFAFDGEWLLKVGNGTFKENPAFIQHACKMWCGSCFDEKDSSNMIIYNNDLRENTAPDSLYNCR